MLVVKPGIGGDGGGTTAVSTCDVQRSGVYFEAGGGKNMVLHDVLPPPEGFRLEFFGTNCTKCDCGMLLFERGECNPKWKQAQRHCWKCCSHFKLCLVKQSSLPVWFDDEVRGALTRISRPRVLQLLLNATQREHRNFGMRFGNRRWLLLSVSIHFVLWMMRHLARRWGGVRKVSFRRRP